MLPRFHLADISTVLHYLGILVLITGVLMFVPLAVALVANESAQAVSFVFGIGVSIFAGSLLFLFRAHRLDRRRSLLLVGGGWVVVGLVASIPMYISGDFASYADALFDAVSAVTTTGSSLAKDVDHIGYAQITWRSVLTLAGGQGVILVAMHLGFFGEGGHITVANKAGIHDDRSFRMKETIQFIVLIGAFFLVIGVIGVYLICLTMGMSVPDAFMTGFWLISNALSTGGFTPHSSSLIYYHSVGLNAFLLIFMLIGSLNFAIFGYALRGKLRPMFHNSETRFFVIWLVILVVAVSFALTRDQIFTSIAGLFSNGTFMAISAATTGGMQTVCPQQFGITISDSVIIILEVAMLIGACSHSTGGGIKMLRIMQVLRWIAYAILVRLMPQNAHVRINYHHFGQKRLTAKDATSAMTIFILYIATAALGSMLFIAHGCDAVKSVYESVSLVSNTGSTAGLLATTEGIDLTLVGILLMWAGRLEFIALIAAVVGLIISLEPGNLMQTSGRTDLERRKSRTKGGTAWQRRKKQGSKRRKSGTGGTVNALGVGLAVLATCALFAGGFMTSSPRPHWPLAATQAYAAENGGAEVSADQIPALQNTDLYRSVEIKALLSATERLDGRNVKFTGEAIGEAIVADADHKWVNVMAWDKSMIGVYMTNEQADAIQHYGAYRMTGDTLLIQGTYSLACTEHNDQIDIHAHTVQISTMGSEYEREWSHGLFTWGLIMGGIGTVIFVITALRRGILRRPRSV